MSPHCSRTLASSPWGQVPHQPPSSPVGQRHCVRATTPCWRWAEPWKQLLTGVLGVTVSPHWELQGRPQSTFVQHFTQALLSKWPCAQCRSRCWEPPAQNRAPTFSLFHLKPSRLRSRGLSLQASSLSLVLPSLYSEPLWEERLGPWGWRAMLLSPLHPHPCPGAAGGRPAGPRCAESMSMWTGLPPSAHMWASPGWTGSA